MNDFYILNKEGNRLFSSSGAFSLIGTGGYVLIKDNDGACFFYNASEEKIGNLPDVVDAKNVYYDVWKHPNPRIIFGYCLSELSRMRFPEFENIPKNKSIVSSFALSGEGKQMFDPIPYFIFPFCNEYLIGYDTRKSLLLFDEKGSIINRYDKNLRFHHYLMDRELNVSEFVVSKLSDKQDKLTREKPLYHLELLSGKIHGPFLEISQIREGVRSVVTLEGESVLFDKEWNEILSLDRFSQNKKMMVTSDCNNGRLAIFIRGEGIAGLLDIEGNLVLKHQYTDIMPIAEDVWFYEKGGWLGLMHDSGEEITPPKFLNNGLYDTSYAHGVIPVAAKGTGKGRWDGQKWGYINLQGEWVIAPEFSFAYSFQHPNFAVVRK